MTYDTRLKIEGDITRAYASVIDMATDIRDSSIDNEGRRCEVLDELWFAMTEQSRLHERCDGQWYTEIYEAFVDAFDWLNTYDNLVKANRNTFADMVIALAYAFKKAWREMKDGKATDRKLYLQDFPNTCEHYKAFSIIVNVATNERNTTAD